MADIAPSKPAFLGIDLGTASTKAVICSIEGEILLTRTLEHAVSTPCPGWVEADAEGMWWAEVINICQSLLPQLSYPYRLAAMAVSGVGPCLVLTDENLRPTRPAILYGVDSRAGEQIKQLNAELGKEAIYSSTGKELSSQAVGPKLLWVKQNEPEVFARSRLWHNSNSYIVGKLTGEYVIDHQSASQSDPLYLTPNQCWNRAWQDRLLGHLKQPRLLWPVEKAGRVTPQAARETGLPEGLEVVIGTVDAWAEAFSAGVSRPGDLMLMYGSTMFMVQRLSRFWAHPTMWSTSGIYPGEFTLAAGMSTSGALTHWARELFGRPSFSELTQEVETVEPGAGALLVLPYFAGERTPVFDDQARGVIAGLTLNHSRGHIFRAIYEGIGYGIRQILEFYARAGNSPQRVFAVGGGSQSRAWLQSVSDITGQVQLKPSQTIGASWGDALLAAIGSGYLPEKTVWAKDYQEIRPRPEYKALYDQLYEEYSRLYPATKSVVHALAELQLLSSEPKRQDQKGHKED